MRVFYEHFCRNDRSSILLLLKNASRVMRAFFSLCSHPFLFAFFGHFLSFFFGKKKRKKVTNKKESLKIKLNIRLKPNLKQFAIKSSLGAAHRKTPIYQSHNVTYPLFFIFASYLNRKSTVLLKHILQND